MYFRTYEFGCQDYFTQKHFVLLKFACISPCCDSHSFAFLDLFFLLMLLFVLQLWSFEKCFMGRYPQTQGFCSCSEFFEWGQVGTDVYIPHKCQVKYHLSPWFSAACATVIVHRNHFFCLHQQNKSEFKVKFRQASNHYKRVLEAAKLAYANKRKLLNKISRLLEGVIDVPCI